MVLFLCEQKHIGRFSNLHQCTFKTLNYQFCFLICFTFFLAFQYLMFVSLMLLKTTQKVYKPDFFQFVQHDTFPANIFLFKNNNRNTKKGMKNSFLLRISSVKVVKPQFPADLVTFTEEVFNGELHFSCSVCFLGQNFKCIFLSNLVCVQNVTGKINKIDFQMRI